jgi:hypothetical protein
MVIVITGKLAAGATARAPAAVAWLAGTASDRPATSAVAAPAAAAIRFIFPSRAALASCARQRHDLERARVNPRHQPPSPL